MFSLRLCLPRVRLRKPEFLSHFYIKTIILPRQALDKHRENSKKDAVFRTDLQDTWLCFQLQAVQTGDLIAHNLAAVETVA
jgi:hypothetical protein